MEKSVPIGGYFRDHQMLPSTCKWTHCLLLVNGASGRVGGWWAPFPRGFPHVVVIGGSSAFPAFSLGWWGGGGMVVPCGSGGGCGRALLLLEPSVKWWTPWFLCVVAADRDLVFTPLGCRAGCQVEWM